MKKVFWGDIIKSLECISDLTLGKVDMELEDDLSSIYRDQFQNPILGIAIDPDPDPIFELIN